MERGRRTERTRLIYHLRVFDRRSGELLGHILDLTTEGMMLMGERELSEGESVPARMKLPANVMGGGEVEFLGVVKWSRPDTEGPFYTSGLEVRELAGAAGDAVAHLIHAFYQEPDDDGPVDLETFV